MNKPIAIPSRTASDGEARLRGRIGKDSRSAPKPPFHRERENRLYRPKPRFIDTAERCEVGKHAFNGDAGRPETVPGIFTREQP